LISVKKINTKAILIKKFKLKNKNALIIGFGSIGRKHFSIIKKLNIFKKIYILTKQKKNLNLISSLKEIQSIKPHYIIISSRTNMHFSQLRTLEKKIKNTYILVEKPLFGKKQILNIKRNKVFVGYNLRFHPVLTFLKKFLQKKKIFSINIVCKSYLPNWRKNIHYSKSNSSKKSYGGGALLELSHELDYLQWLFGKIKKIEFSKLRKVSNLNVDCEDSALIIGKTDFSHFLLDLNFYSTRPERTLKIDGRNFSIKADLIKNQIEILKGRKLKIIKFNNNKNTSYNKLHNAILTKKLKNVCSYSEGKNLMNIIEEIKEKNIK